MNLIRAQFSRLPAAVRLPVGTVAAVLAILGVTALLGLEAPSFVIVLGALIGVSYGLLGVCLVLIFRVSSVINFAQPAIGLFAMSFMPILIQVLGVPWWVAFVAVIPIGFFTGALVDGIVVRRVQSAPRVVGVVATLGVAGVLAAATGYVLEFADTALEPLSPPPGLPSFTIGPLLVSAGYTGLIVSAPLLTAALAFFLTRSRVGLSVLASASSPENARLAGISPGLVSMLVWGIAGAISTIAVVFFLGTPPGNPTAAIFSPSTLLPALGAAAIGGFRSLPRSLAAGIVIGIAQQIALWSPESARYSDLMIFVLLLIALLAVPRSRGRGETVGAWTAVTTWRPLPPRLADLWLVRNYGRLFLVLLAAALILFALRDDITAQSWTLTVCVAVLSLSVALITGLAGELSLGQFSVALVAGATSLVVVRDTGNFLLGLISAAVVGGVVALALAYPALRARGLTMTVLTLAFAVAVPTAILTDPRVMGQGVVAPAQPVIGGVAVQIGRPYFVFALAVAVICGWIAWNAWRGGFGRIVRAGRDNESAAQAFGLRVFGSQLKMLAVSGVIAGIAGAVLIHSYTTVAASALPFDINIKVVLAVVMGGLGVLYGGPVGVVWLFASAVAQATTDGAATTSSSQAASLAIYASALILILVAPGGAAQLLEPARNLIAVGIGRVFGVRYTLAQLRGEKRLEEAAPGVAAPQDEAIDRANTALEVTAGRDPLPGLTRPRTPASTDAPAGSPLLSCRGLRLHHGAVKAVDGVDLQVEQGRIRGLIGPNGAGKTSTFELISGFARPDGGEVLFDGRDITRLPPHRRAHLGLVRSFQNPQLFPTMSTLDVVELALEREQPTSTVRSLLGIDLTVRRRRQAANAVIDFFGLAPYRESRVKELSTGTRRFVELAALISMGPRLLLLDEPSSGVAQREIEALGPLLLRIRDAFDLTMVVIEHDIPLIMSIADRVTAMAEGRVLTEGTPDEVRADQRLIDAYLGGSAAAINRSDQPVTGTTALPGADSELEGERP